MTSNEIDLVRRAIELLNRLVRDGQGRAGAPGPRLCPVERFVQEYLSPDCDADLTCEEAWQLFQEIAQAGELSPMRRTVFLRRLPVVMESIHDVRKSHSVERNGRRVRGFRGVDIGGQQFRDAMME
jgi:hypothetical protein